VLAPVVWKVSHAMPAGSSIHDFPDLASQQVKIWPAVRAASRANETPKLFPRDSFGHQAACYMVIPGSGHSTGGNMTRAKAIKAVTDVAGVSVDTEASERIANSIGPAFEGFAAISGTLPFDLEPASFLLAQGLGGGK